MALKYCALQHGRGKDCAGNRTLAQADPARREVTGGGGEGEKEGPPTLETVFVHP